MTLMTRDDIDIDYADAGADDDDDDNDDNDDAAAAAADDDDEDEDDDDDDDDDDYERRCPSLEANIATPMQLQRRNAWRLLREVTRATRHECLPWQKSRGPGEARWWSVGDYTLEDQHGTWKWWFGRSFSFPNGSFVGSMLIFQGVSFAKSWKWTMGPSNNS